MCVGGRFLPKTDLHIRLFELQFDVDKFEQYFSLTREFKISPNCSGNTFPWRHILDSRPVFTVCRILIDTQPHDKSYARRRQNNTGARYPVFITR